MWIVTIMTGARTVYARSANVNRPVSTLKCVVQTISPTAAHAWHGVLGCRWSLKGPVSRRSNVLRKRKPVIVSVEASILIYRKDASSLHLVTARIPAVKMMNSNAMMGPASISLCSATKRTTAPTERMKKGVSLTAKLVRSSVMGADDGHVVRADGKSSKTAETSIVS